MEIKDTERKLDTLSDRLAFALEITGTKKADLARAIDVKPQIIQFLCDSSTRSSRFTFEIATALGLNTRWLAVGEGAMFLADDPKHKLLIEYKPIPLLTSQQLLIKAQNKPIDLTNHKEWVALKTKKENIFCIQIQDASMEPYLPINSFVFFEEILEYFPKNKDIALIFIPQYNTFIIRELSIENTKTYMVPKNIEFLKKTLMADDSVVIGVAIEYHWSIRS